MKNITIGDLQKLISLDASTGLLTWRERDPSFFVVKHDGYTGERTAKIWNKRYAGSPALSAPHRMGYLTGKLLNVDVLAHRVVWALHHGKWPDHNIDHINGIKTDNRPCNLRDVTQLENARNQQINKNSTTGVLGVFYRAKNKKYDAHIKVNGKRKYLGAFSSLDEAVAARKKADQKAGFHENHGRKAV